MRFNQRFIHGRLRRRMLRPPAVDGWLADELGQRPPERAERPLRKIEGDCLALPIPEGNDLARLSPAATAAAGDDAEILIGWPESMVIIRRKGVVVHAEGDVVHFGRLALDGRHALERTGYQYLADTGIEVRVELALESDGQVDRRLFDPDASAELGPYAIEHGHSFDPSDRPSGARQHGYAFVVRRRGPLAAEPVAPAGVPHPLDVAEPEVVVALARARGLLGPDEALAGEAEMFSALLDRYEGPRQNLEEAVRAAAPAPLALTRRGESVVVESALLLRGDKGDPHHGRATLALDPTGGLIITRTELGTMPGRLRKAH